MAKNTSVDKSREMITQFKMGEKIQVNESGTVDINAGLFKEAVLDPIDISMDQYNKLKQNEVDFLAAVTLHVGEQLPKIVSENKDISEIGFNYKMGKNTQAAVNWRITEGQPIRTVACIETTVKSAEMNRVTRYIDSLFADINN